MHTTLVRWREAPGAVLVDTLMLKMQELLGDDWDYYESFFRSELREDGEQESVRVWPDLSTAESWIAFVKSLDTPPMSAVIASEE